MPPAGFEPTVSESKQLITRKNITCLFYGTLDFSSNFSGSFHWNQGPSQGGESGAVHPVGISKMSKINMLISSLKYAQHPTASMCYIC